jgi:uncharacterized protein YcbK (DUF882 family)
LIPSKGEGRRLYRIDKLKGSELKSLLKDPKKNELESVSSEMKDLKYRLYTVFGRIRSMAVTSRQQVLAVVDQEIPERRSPGNEGISI